MERKLINNQLTNLATYNFYVNQCKAIAQNAFIFVDLPETINRRFLNKTLLHRGSIAFFKDEIMGLLCLPFENKTVKKDVYDEPYQITVRANNGYTRNLTKDEFVIMYDNDLYINIMPYILQYAERLSLCIRTCDINISQQKTNRFWKTKNENLASVKSLINKIDTFQELIITYQDYDLDDTTACVEPAPYVTDKIDLHYEKIWNEFLRFCGVANLSYTKKERNISDEINAMQGGTVISRLNRYSPREDAVKKINEKFGVDIKVKYYDGLPSTDEKDNEGGSDNDFSDLSDEFDDV